MLLESLIVVRVVMSLSSVATVSLFCLLSHVCYVFLIPSFFFLPRDRDFFFHLSDVP